MSSDAPPGSRRVTDPSWQLATTSAGGRVNVALMVLWPLLSVPGGLPGQCRDGALGDLRGQAAGYPAQHDVAPAGVGRQPPGQPGDVDLALAGLGDKGAADVAGVDRALVRDGGHPAR